MPLKRRQSKSLRAQRARSSVQEEEPAFYRPGFPGHSLLMDPLRAPASTTVP